MSFASPMSIVTAIPVCGTDNVRDMLSRNTAHSLTTCGSTVAFL